jgi:hypothetical protein
MHGTFVFLIDNLDEPISSDAPIDNGNLQDGIMDRSEAIGIVESTFLREYEDVLDENNWHETMAVLFQDGTLWNTCDPEDYRGRGNFASGIEERYPDKSDRWEWGLRFATGCVALDVGLRGSTDIAFIPTDANKEIDDMSYEELVKAIKEEVPQELSKAYANISISDSNDVFDTESYIRQKKSSTFEKFNTSHIKPFTIYRDSPYSYRCFDLRSKSDGTELSEDTVMLFVDIHT